MAARGPAGRDVRRFVQYAVAAVGIVLVTYLREELWDGVTSRGVKHPWRLLAVVAVPVLAVWAVGPHPRLARWARRTGRRLGIR